MEFIIEESAAYVQGGGRDTDGTRRKSGGKVEEEGGNPNPAEIKEEGGWSSAGAGCEPSPRLSHDLAVT